MRIKKLLLASLLWPALASANDGVSAVSAGGIVVYHKTDAVAMKKEVLNVSQALISVDYEFVNESGADVEETIAFPMPVYPAGQDPSPRHYGQPDGFSIMVDGKPVAFTTNLVALLNGEPVTAQLKQLGLSDAQIATNFTFSNKVTPLTPLQVRQLGKLHLMHGLDTAWQGPAWDVQVTYVWKQKFPVNKVVRVHHAYRPLASHGPSEMSMDAATAASFCADAGFMKAWKRRAAQTGYLVEANHVGYILKTGNTWKNGIEDFTLNLIKQDSEELISLCFPGTFKKVDAHTFQVRLKNFRPKDDLYVYFGTALGGQYEQGDGVMPILPR